MKNFKIFKEIYKKFYKYVYRNIKKLSKNDKIL